MRMRVAEPAENPQSVWPRGGDKNTPLSTTPFLNGFTGRMGV